VLIQQRWEGIVQVCDFNTGQRCSRILSAFGQVLMSMPEYDFQVFWVQNALLN
jgi:hypothetical protein